MSSAAGNGSQGALGRWIAAIPALGVLGVGVILSYAWQIPAGARWRVFGTAVAIAGAAGLVGGVIGFLFGIPRTVLGSAAPTPETQYQGNTNLEQVSDWLTKILVGVGLVQIGRALPALTKLADNLKAPLGGQASSAAFGLALVISYAVLGFMFLYLWSREILPRELPISGIIQQQLDARESIRSTALNLVNRQLDSLKGGVAPTQDELNTAIAAAPDSTQLQIFNEAEQVRTSNWREDKPKMAKSIPVFRALIAADTGERYHRNHGSLGWALKDKVSPEWQEAYDELTKAITIRDKLMIAGWKLYEANRALCGIHLIEGLPAGDPKAVSLRAAIDQDLRDARENQYGLQMVDSNEDIQRWLR